MKELCSCNCCSREGKKSVTPWCDMLSRNSGPYTILHLWYKLSFLSEEVQKRTAYIGKFRRTEDTKHLLDLIAMTDDEKNMFVPFAKAAMADVFDVLYTYIPTCEKTCHWMEGRETITFTDEPTKPDPPVKFKEGDYVMYNGNLYVAIKDGDSDDVSGKLLPTEDYRKSIHFGIKWNCSSNINAVDPLDTGIFEALVARIIYKWLEYAYPEPQELKRFLDKYNECIVKIGKRATILEGSHIVNRIPRDY